jgi:hypothetical protein
MVIAGETKRVALDYDQVADADIAVDGTLGVKVPPDKREAVRGSGRRLYARHPWYCGSVARADLEKRA